MVILDGLLPNQLHFVSEISVSLMYHGGYPQNEREV